MNSVLSWGLVAAGLVGGAGFAAATPSIAFSKNRAGYIDTLPTVSGYPALANFGTVRLSYASGAVENSSGDSASGPIDAVCSIGGVTYQVMMDQITALIAGVGGLFDSGSGSTATSSFAAVYVREPNALPMLAVRRWA